MPIIIMRLRGEQCRCDFASFGYYFATGRIGLLFMARNRNQILKAAAARRPQGALHHIRRSVLLLLGFYNVRLHQGIARYAHEADWVLDDTYVSAGLVPVWWDGDGILGLITSPKDVTAARHFPKCPLVDVSQGWISKSMPARYRASGLGRPRVYYDNARIARLSAEHFLARGFKHIAFLNYGNYWHEVERIPTYQKVIERAGADYHEIEYYRHFPPHSARTVQNHLSAQRWLIQKMRDLPKPLAITVASDNVSMRLFGACDAAGVSVPEEVAILGCDNDPLICEAAPVALSSVDNDWDRIGYEAAQLLDRLMAGKRVPREPVLIPPKGVAALQHRLADGRQGLESIGINGVVGTSRPQGFVIEDNGLLGHPPIYHGGETTRAQRQTLPKLRRRRPIPPTHIARRQGCGSTARFLGQGGILVPKHKAQQQKCSQPHHFSSFKWGASSTGGGVSILQAWACSRRNGKRQRRRSRRTLLAVLGKTHGGFLGWIVLHDLKVRIVVKMPGTPAGQPRLICAMRRPAGATWRQVTRSTSARVPF